MQEDFNRVEILLGVVADIIKAIPIHQGPISRNLTPEVMMELDRLEKAMGEFRDINKQSYKTANVDIDKLRRETFSSEQITPKQKQILIRALEIENEARALQSQYAQVLAMNKIEAARLTGTGKEGEKREIKDRRKRYKPIGGDKKWIPI